MLIECLLYIVSFERLFYSHGDVLCLLGIHGHWTVNLLHLLWHGISVFHGLIRRARKFIPVAERLAVVLYILDCSWSWVSNTRPSAFEANALNNAATALMPFTFDKLKSLSDGANRFVVKLIVFTYTCITFYNLKLKRWSHIRVNLNKIYGKSNSIRL